MTAAAAIQGRVITTSSRLGVRRLGVMAALVQGDVFEHLAITGQVAVDLGQLPGNLADAADGKADGPTADQTPAMASQAEVIRHHQAQGRQVDGGGGAPGPVDPDQQEAGHPGQTCNLSIMSVASPL